jgi:microcystin degradation protein MlrC
MLCEDIFGHKKRMARAALPVIAPAHAYTTTEGALKALKDKAQAMIADGKISDYSVFQVQPWLDAPIVSSSILVIANDEDTAVDVANELARDAFECRAEIQGKPVFTVEQVIQKALDNDNGKPIVLVDSADSIGAGSTGDSAAVTAALLPYADCLYAATEVRDVAAVKKAFEVGVGNTADFVLGATIAPKLSEAVKVTAKVKSLHDGTFYANGPMAKNAKYSSGRTAILEVGKLLIRVSETGAGSNDVNFYRSFGVSFNRFALVSVKACTSFRASYGKYVSEIYNTATAGAAGTVLSQLGFKRRPVPLYPFEQITENDIKWARVYR